MALEWFEPDLLNTGDLADHPLWMDSWLDFVVELQTTFGPHDPVADTKHQLDHLHMKETHRVNHYVVDFNCLASQVQGYGDGTLCHLFYSGLPDRIKDEISRVGKPNTLYGLHALAQEIDVCYWERKDEVARQTKSSGGSSSNNTGNKGNSSKGDKQKSSGNTPASPNTPTPSTSTPKPQNQQSSRQPSGLSNKLGKDGKLTPAERKRHFNQNLSPMSPSDMESSPRNSEESLLDSPPISSTPLDSVDSPTPPGLRAPHISLINTAAYVRACKLDGSIQFSLQVRPQDSPKLQAASVQDTPDLSSVSSDYHNFADMFSKAKASTLAPH
ncbi:hypothetical protein PISMIDRAFT_18538 [Pisolithus microcarpus 441]|uniref:Retrotransposon gag domain-containing protein n=1 Tax=Pisolithus microcarpus 441 TaxID=765257 RepID=A0A0C9YFK1_9AGAM|nr:hypothetical protein PISMIDRAFT_18538 [Pisolithus microcarpus 441]